MALWVLARLGGLDVEVKERGLEWLHKSYSGEIPFGWKEHTVAKVLGKLLTGFMPSVPLMLMQLGVSLDDAIVAGPLLGIKERREHLMDVTELGSCQGGTSPATSRGPYTPAAGTQTRAHSTTWAPTCR
jgi:hypothetical protein